MECNFNAEARTYNPHFHLVVASKDIADYIINEWCKLLTFKFARTYTQKKRKVDNLEGALKETIKYGSKILNNPEKKSKGNKNNTPFIYTSALHNIIVAMKGNRIFDRFGFNLPKESNKTVNTSKKLINFDEWQFNPDLSNWVNEKTGELISGYNLPPELKRLLHYNIISDIQ